MERRSFPPPTALPVLLLLALVLRLAATAWSFQQHPEIFHPDRAALAAALADPTEPTVTAPGFEVSNVAWSLVCAGRGFASPFGGDSGPTGWVSPGIVAVWGAAYATAGCFTTASLLALLAVAAVASLLMVAVAADAGTRLAGDPRGGALAALFVACSPWDLALFVATDWMDLNLGALALLTLLWLLLRLRDRPGRGRLAAFAAASAVATLLNPVFFFAAAAGFAVVLAGLPRRRRAAALFLALHVLLLAPWIVYQRCAVGGWFFVKSNAPFEIALGNRPEVGGVLRDAVFDAHHPSQNETEYRRYRRQGELVYVDRQLARFLRELEVSRFVATTGRRLAGFFFSSAAEPWQGTASRWRSRVLALLPGLVLVLYPLARRLGGRRLDRGDALLYAVVAGYAAPYLIAAVMARYTLPMTPAVLLLAARAGANFVTRLQRITY